MKLIVNVKSDRRLSDFLPGQCFMRNDEYFMVVQSETYHLEEQPGICFAVDLVRGSFDHHQSSMVVTPVEIEAAVVERK